MAGTALTAAAPPPAAASRPAAPSTGSAGAPPPAPRAYAQVAAAPPPTATSSLPPAASATSYSGRGPFPNMTRKHGVRCLLVPASPHVETYVRALARVVGPTAIAAASKMYGKVVFFLASEAAAQEAVEKGLAVGGVFVPLEPLDDLGVRLVLTSVPPFLPNAALLPALSTLGKPISVLSPLPLGCKDPALRHVLSFRRQVQLQLPPAARDGEALEGSFLIPYQGAHYRVTQGEDDPLLAGLDLSDLAPAPPVPCPLPPPVTFATASEGPQGSSICPAVSGTLRLDAEPTEATAGALWLGPEPHGLPLEDVGRLTSFPGGDPTAGAVAPLPVVVPESDILEGPLPHPHLPEPDREGPFSTGLAPGAQAPALAPLPGSVPDPCLALPRDPCPAPDVNPAPAPPTSRAVTAAPGAVISSPHEDSPRGAAPVFPSPDSLGAATLPPPPPLQPGVEEGCVAPVHQAPRRGSAPCLPVSAGHGAVSAVPPEDSRGLVAPAPHALREELREFLEDVRGSRNKVQLALQRWGDFHLILRAARALMGEGKRTGKQAATAYQRVRLFRDSLMTYGVGHGLLRGPLGTASVPAGEDPPQPSSWHLLPSSR
ncbi:unnamed protein product [Caretta caretta]